MANPYFSAFYEYEQQKLYRSLIDECVNFFGIDSVYIPRGSMSEVDLLFGDDPTKMYTTGYTVTMLITTTEEFDGDIAAFSKFGLVINKQLRLLLAHDAFGSAVGSATGFTRPREGDVVWMPNFQAFFEIKFVNQDNFMYAFGNQGNPFYGYELILEEFRYNNEIVDSGFNEPDEKIANLVFTYMATMAGGTISYINNETVYQGANLNVASAQANVSSWNLATGELALRNIQGMFVPTQNIVGQTSNAQWQLVQIELFEDINNDLENNVLIRDEANTSLDLTEHDPLFGNPITYIGQE